MAADKAPIEPWDREKTRFGFTLGARVGSGRQALGYAVVRLGRPPELTRGTHPVVGDPIDTLMAHARKAIADGAEGVTLYRYSPTSFAGSRAAAEGMTREAHGKMIDRAAEALRAEGIAVDIEYAP